MDAPSTEQASTAADEEMVESHDQGDEASDEEDAPPLDEDHEDEEGEGDEQDAGDEVIISNGSKQKRLKKILSPLLFTAQFLEENQRH